MDSQLPPVDSGYQSPFSSSLFLIKGSSPSLFFGFPCGPLQLAFAELHFFCYSLINSLLLTIILLTLIGFMELCPSKCFQKLLSVGMDRGGLSSHFTSFQTINLLLIKHLEFSFPHFPRATLPPTRPHGAKKHSQKHYIRHVLPVPQNQQCKHVFLHFPKNSINLYFEILFLLMTEKYPT